MVLSWLGAGCASAPGASHTATPAQASASASAPAASEPEIAETWRARCGQCHRRVEPGTRTRAHLEDALSRHRKRAHLSEEQWRALIDFLATPTSAS